MNIESFIAAHWLDMLTTILGLAYIALQYRASIWLWAVGFVMQVLGIVLYYQKGLYADCGMEFYYLAVTVYGIYTWRFGRKKPQPSPSPSQSSHSSRPADSVSSQQPLPITHFPRHLLLPWTLATLAIWATIYWFLTTYTDSRVPLADSFTTALSIVGIWALARKYLEQWLIWIAVDIVTSVLYFYKDIPFKASLYALYVVIAIFGYRKWKKQLRTSPNYVQTAF